MTIEIRLTIESDTGFDTDQQFGIQCTTNEFCSKLEDELAPNRDRFITYKMIVDGVKYEREF